MMRGSLKKKRILLIIVILLVFSVVGCIAGIYLSRPPLLIVTDSSFTALYGEKRLKRVESRLSRELFRRVIPVYIDENAGPDIVAIAVEDAYKSPRAVIFPFRRFTGARTYKDENPDVPVYVMAGAGQGAQEETDLAFIRTDTRVDLYRAGLCAALLAGENEVLFISDGTLSEELLDAFREGLKMQGYLDDPSWGNTYTDYSSHSNLGCVVLAGPATAFLEENPSVPMLVFSWIDPAFTPLSVKIVFDDSPWVLASKAFKSLPPPGGETFIGSSPTVFKDRITEKRDFRKLKSLLKEEFTN